MVYPIVNNPRTIPQQDCQKFQAQLGLSVIPHILLYTVIIFMSALLNTFTVAFLDNAH